MEATQELKQTLRRLRLSAMLGTLPERFSYAKSAKLSYSDFLELILQDEIERRDQKMVTVHLQAAMLDHDQVLERFDWDANIKFDRDKLKNLFNLGFIERHENVIFSGPAGVGKTFLANAIGHAAVRSGKKVLALRATKLLKTLYQSRADNSFEKELVKLLTPDLLIIDDFGLQALTKQQSTDFYELVIERHARSSTIITSNRHVDEWIALFDDQILANSAVDRFAHNAHQFVIEGESYRSKTAKQRGLTGQ